MSEESIKMICQNKKAFHNFHIEKKFEAGIILKGSEVKSCRQGKVQLVDSYAAFKKHELYLVKAHISEFKQGGPFFNHPPVQDRKLLMHKREILNIKALLEQQKLTLVPLKMYFKKGKAKVELGLARGKTHGDKRHSLKEKESDRKMAQAQKRERGK